MYARPRKNRFYYYYDFACSVHSTLKSRKRSLCEFGWVQVKKKYPKWYGNKERKVKKKKRITPKSKKHSNSASYTQYKQPTCTDFQMKFIWIGSGKKNVSANDVKHCWTVLVLYGKKIRTTIECDNGVKHSTYS